MKLTVTGSNSQPMVLGDDSLGDYIFGDLPSQSRVMDVQPYLRAAFQEVLRVTNRLNNFTISVEKKHESKDDATIYKYIHADSVPGLALVELRGESDFYRALKDAGISNVACTYHNGITTIFTYTIAGGEWLLAAPVS